MWLEIMTANGGQVPHLLFPLPESIEQHLDFRRMQAATATATATATAKSSTSASSSLWHSGTSSLILRPNAAITVPKIEDEPDWPTAAANVPKIEDEPDWPTVQPAPHSDFTGVSLEDIVMLQSQTAQWFDNVAVAPAGDVDRGGEEVDKNAERRRKRMIKNRESAARSRAKKQAYIKQLEERVKELEKANKRLKMEKVLELRANSIPDPKAECKLQRSSSCPNDFLHCQLSENT